MSKSYHTREACFINQIGLYKNKLFDASELINIRLAPTCRQYINMSTDKISCGVSHSFGINTCLGRMLSTGFISHHQLVIG